MPSAVPSVLPPFVLGIDVAKAGFNTALLTADNAPKHKHFANTEAGFAALLVWLKSHFAAPEQIHACLESTGPYSDALARFLHERGSTVSLVNPATISAFAKSQLSRGKTDKTDAALIARFTKALRPPAWEPPAPEVAHLQALVRRLDALQQMRQAEANRLEGDPPSAVRASVDAVLALLDEQIKAIRAQIAEHIENTPMLKERRDLLTTIPGIGEATAASLLAEIPGGGDLSHFRGGAPALAAFAGVSPQLKESGSSVRGKARLCKVGSARLRKTLFLPALVARQHNPLVKAFAERLLARGKAKMCVAGAAMRKLLHIVFGVLKSGRPFDPHYANPCNSQRA